MHRGCQTQANQIHRCPINTISPHPQQHPTPHACIDHGEDEEDWACRDLSAKGIHNGVEHLPMLLVNILQAARAEGGGAGGCMAAGAR